MKLLYRFGVDFAFVGKISVQFRGKEKIRLFGGSLQPRFGSFLEWRPVKGAVDFHAIHKSADKFKLVDFRSVYTIPFQSG